MLPLLITSEAEADLADAKAWSGVRRVVVRQFPYGVFYRIDPDQIAVLAAYHSKRDPKGWQGRV